ncbi:hypothetical protein GF406_21415 [candidate division KSB1 bacterium]|nr:hypothetical protein [candidate division KSB1 bacterium]
MKNELRALIGEFPASESGFRKRMRFHQGWWRTFVLAKEEGNHPIKKEKKVCNTILHGQTNQKNFLSPGIAAVVLQTIQERKSASKGILEEDRLYNNLLSSQPLCFNFFDELKIDTNFALAVLKQFWSELTQVKRVIFEFAPPKNYTGDNSAFDVAFEVMAGNKKGLIGLECKYTDTFSHTEYDKSEYRQIFVQSGDRIFNAKYENFNTARFNQLFRNQLIATASLQSREYAFVYTGLFCHQDDKSALQTSTEFQGMIKNDDNLFQVITYQDFITKIQRLPLSWKQRELSMLLWARYCSTQLSEQVFQC